MRRKSVWTAVFALCAVVGVSLSLPLFAPPPAEAVVISSGPTDITAQNGTVTLGVVGNESCVQITGTWTGTMSFQGTVDDSNWFAIPGIPPTASTPVPVTSTTANGQWLVPSAPYKTIRVKSTAAQTGTASVIIVNGSGATAVMTYSGGGGGTVTLGAGSALIGKVGIDQTTPGTTNLTYGARAQPAVQSVTIATGANTLSAEIDLGTTGSFGLILPSDWVTSNILFQVSDTSGGTYVPLYNDSSTRITITAAVASQAYGMETITGTLFPWRYLKVQSVTSQAGTRTFKVVGKS